MDFLPACGRKLYDEVFHCEDYVVWGRGVVAHSAVSAVSQAVSQMRFACACH